MLVLRKSGIVADVPFGRGDVLVRYLYCISGAT